MTPVGAPKDTLITSESLVEDQSTAPVAQARERTAPRVSSRSNGRLGKTLETIANSFTSNNPDRHPRFVFHSAHKPELSNMMSRSADGYRVVTLEDFADTMLIKPFVDEKGFIRVADTVLMAIPVEAHAEIRAERRELADEQLASVKDQFDTSMDAVTQGRHRAVARGAASLETRDHEYNIEQRSGE